MGTVRLSGISAMCICSMRSIPAGKEHTTPTFAELCFDVQQHLVYIYHKGNSELSDQLLYQGMCISRSP